MFLTGLVATPSLQRTLSAMGIEAVQARISQIQALASSFQPSFMTPASPTAPSNVQAAPSSTFAQALTQASVTKSGVDPVQFSTDVLGKIGAPVTEQNMAVMQAWIKSEGTRADFNPLATTRRAEGATDFNSVGVKNFTTYEQGVDTTVGAITNGLYDNVIAALRRGNDAFAVADAIAASPWGSGTLVREVLESNRSTTA
jgi:hypothetical protein